METRLGSTQIELDDNVPETISFLEQHCAFLSSAENWANEDCLLPRTTLFDFRPTRQPVCVELWEPLQATPNPNFTTVGNWRQQWREVTFRGQTYSWSKHVEFEKYLSLPGRTGQDFELALSGCDQSDRGRLLDAGWRIRDGLELFERTRPLSPVRRGSLGEFTVAKEQNVVMRSGWFSDRSATYLAAGRPVITQETGFFNVLPTGEGLHAFTSPRRRLRRSIG